MICSPVVKKISHSQTMLNSQRMGFTLLTIKPLCPYQESNLSLFFRRELFYPLNYRDKEQKPRYFHKQQG